jgi:predicted transposase/invertase (TIGR01784 family)
MQTIQLQLQDELYEDILSRGIDINHKIQDFLYSLVDNKYQSISTDEAKQRVGDAINRYNNDTGTYINQTQYLKHKDTTIAKETLDYLEMDEKEKYSYDARQEDKRREASVYESTYVIGGIEGEKRKAIEIALKSLKKGLDIEMVAEITGLSIEDVVNLTSNDEAVETKRIEE